MAIKTCKECGKEISSSAKKCPNCGKDQRNQFAKHKIITAVLVLVVVGIIGYAAGGEGGSGSNNNPSQQNAATGQPKASPMVVTTDKLMEDLKSNALNASNNYKGKYVEVTGKLSNIDSSGKYFGITPMNNDFAIIGVQCYITEEQKAAVSKLTIGQKVTVVGAITDVGELMGYSLRVESIK